MKKNTKKAVFNVLIWDFNRDNIQHYDVLPYLRSCYQKRIKDMKSKRIQKYLSEYPNDRKYYMVPETKEEFKDFILDESRYMYWSRCEWEMIIQGWPVQKNAYKIDVHEQITMNLDVVADILYNEFKKSE